MHTGCTMQIGLLAWQLFGPKSHLRDPPLETVNQYQMRDQFSPRQGWNIACAGQWTFPVCALSRDCHQNQRSWSHTCLAKSASQTTLELANFVSCQGRANVEICRSKPESAFVAWFACSKATSSRLNLPCRTLRKIMTLLRGACRPVHLLCHCRQCQCKVKSNSGIRVPNKLMASCAKEPFPLTDQFRIQFDL